MSESEQLLLKAIVELHKELMTVIGAIANKADADMIFDHYTKEMNSIVEEGKKLTEGEK